MPHHEFSFKAPDQTDLFAQEWIPETSPPKYLVVLVHGYGEHSGRYQHVAKYFNAKSTIVCALDNYGHGHSGGKRGHIPKFEQFFEIVNRFVNLAKQRHPNLPTFLYGHSMGGNLSLNYLFRYQPTDLKGVIATASAVKLAYEPPKILVWLGQITRKLMPSLTQDNKIPLETLSRNPAIAPAYASDPLNHHKITSEEGIGLLEAGRYLFDNQNETKTPLLLMHGTADGLIDVISSKQVAANTKGDVTLKLWEGFYHELHNEPEQLEVLDYVWDWMQKR